MSYAIKKLIKFIVNLIVQTSPYISIRVSNYIHDLVKKNHPDIELKSPYFFKVDNLTLKQLKGLVHEVEDPQIVLNTVLQIKALTPKVFGIFIRSIFTSRDKVFFQMLGSKTAITNPVLNNIFHLYKHEYEGNVETSENISSIFKTLQTSDYKMSKQDELYILLAAIKSESLDLVAKLLPELNFLNKSSLPPLYKTGILRLSAQQSNSDYSHWRSLLEINAIESLQILELDQHMLKEKNFSHKDYPEMLNAVLSDPLKAELNECILPFFENHKEQLKWMDCRFNADQKQQFLDLIEQNIVQQTAWSLIRLGDGESYAWQSELPAEKAAMRENLWWDTTLPKDLRAKISSEILTSIESADVLGVPSLGRFTRDISPSLKSFKGHRSISGLIFVLNGVASLKESPRLFTEERIHQICFDLSTIIKLGKKAKKILIISSVQKDILERHFNPIQNDLEIDYIGVPTHTKTRTSDLFITSDKPLPFVYEEINAEVISKVEPGTLVLVASGSIGKIFIQTARANRGVALDVGAMIDYWIGVKTRSIADIV